MNEEEGWRRQGRRGPLVEEEEEVAKFAEFAVQIVGPQAAVQQIWRELVADQPIELMAEWLPTWYGPGVQKHRSKLMWLNSSRESWRHGWVDRALQRDSEVRITGAADAQRAECSAEIN